VTEWSADLCIAGVVRLGLGRCSGPEGVTNHVSSRRFLERTTVGGESPVGERDVAPADVLEYHGTRGIPWEAGGTTLQG
jgi:hypothetical protein